MKLRVWVTVVVMGVFAACNKAPDDLIPGQRSRIESYLGDRDYTYLNGAYRYIANADRDSYPYDPVAVEGDSLYYYFAGYTFVSAPDMLFLTNFPELLAQDTIINTRYWPLDPVGVRVGETPMLRGLAEALPYCRQNDSLMVLMTSDMAYGSVGVGLVPANTAIMMILGIKEVKKQN